MELYKELLIHVLSQESIQLSFPNMQEGVSALLERECYRVLEKIKAALADDRLDDRECFYRIEEIIRAFEESGSSGETRHDFG